MEATRFAADGLDLEIISVSDRGLAAEEAVASATPAAAETEAAAAAAAKAAEAATEADEEDAAAVATEAATAAAEGGARMSEVVACNADLSSCGDADAVGGPPWELEVEEVAATEATWIGAPLESSGGPLDFAWLRSSGAGGVLDSPAVIASDGGRMPCVIS